MSKLRHSSEWLHQIYSRRLTWESYLIRIRFFGIWYCSETQETFHHHEISTSMLLSLSSIGRANQEDHEIQRGADHLRVAFWSLINREIDQIRYGVRTNGNHIVVFNSDAQRIQFSFISGTSMGDCYPIQEKVAKHIRIPFFYMYLFTIN